MAERYKTLGATTLAEALDASETGVDVTSAAALRDSFSAGDTYRIRIDDEIFTVTAEAGNTLTVAARPSEGTTAATHSNGATVTHVVTGALLDQLKVDANLLSVAANRGESILAASYDIVAATGVWADTGISVALPGAGTFELSAHLTGFIYLNAGSAGCQVDVKLYNSTDAADVAGTISFLVYAASDGVTMISHSSIQKDITVAAAKTIKVYARRTFTAATNQSQVVGTQAYSKLMFKRIAA